MSRTAPWVLVLFLGACGGGDSGESTAADPNAPGITATTSSSSGANASSSGTSGSAGSSGGSAGSSGSSSGDMSSSSSSSSSGTPVSRECERAADCASSVCTPMGTCAVATNSDGVKNQGETDVDCGGPNAPTCAATKACGAAADCASKVCTASTCREAAFNDGVKNGTESDVDCGGAAAVGAQKCATGKACMAHTDCASNGCGDDGKCADFPTCTQAHGGRSCGAGETGAAGASHESCCTETPIATRPAVKLDKYLITAGRMRAFIERVGGNVRDAVKTNPKWVGAWTSYMPTNMAEANAQLGPYAMDWEWPAAGIATLPRATWAARGCSIAGFGARTYWQPPIGAEHNYYSQDALDEKALNCVTTAMSLAMCLYDGKDLADPDDLHAAWAGSDGRMYPWGNNPAPPTMDGEFSQYVVHRFNYQFPDFLTPDASSYVAPPGRRPMGNGPYGHADLAGNLIEQARRGSVGYYLSGGSWERHDVNKYGNPYTANSNTNGDTVWNRRYYAIGARCARH